MLSAEHEDRLTTYFVELSTPDSGWADIQGLAASARRAAGGDVQFLRSVFVPESGICFLVYEGSSAAAVRDAVASIELPIRRVEAALRQSNEGGAR